MDGKEFRELVGGRRRDWMAGLLRGILVGAEWPYSSVVCLRNFLYDQGFFRTRRVSVPTLSVGNLTLGGTGKSPMVAWLGRFFLENGSHPGIVSRGFGRSSDGVNDEFRELAFRLPTVPHVQNPDRIAAAETLLRQYPQVDRLILDDAMQHRRIARDLDIVLLDATEPFGFEHVFPRGTLREPIRGIRRADVVLLSRADLLTEQERHAVRERVFQLTPRVLWGEIAHHPEKLVSPDHRETELSRLHGQRVLAFCGIGNPDAFRKTLEDCQAEVLQLVAFPDHHRFSDADLTSLSRKTNELGADLTVCTMKDLVKIDRSELGGKPFFALTIGIRFLVGEREFRKRLSSIETGLEPNCDR